METKVFKVEGMNCNHCEKAVKDALEGVSGVQSVEIDLEGGQATVTFDATQTIEASLKETVEKAGYSVAV